MQRGAWVAAALFAAACQPSSLAPPAPDQNTWVTVDAGRSSRDASPKDAPARRDAGPVDRGRPDALAPDTGADRPARDAEIADAGGTCGPMHFICTPYLCDVDAGRCQSTCNGPADCTNGRPCVGNACQVDDLTAVCTTGSECLTGFCVDGVCCNSACTGPCRTCVQPGAIGTCEPVAPGALDPHRICATGSVCSVNGACVPTSCTADQDCGELELCTGGTCHPCNATCVTDSVCIPGSVCVHRNSCTACGPRPDAGTDAR